MGLIYSVSVLFFTFMIFRMYLKKDIRPYMTSRVVTLLTILGLLPYVNTVIIIATLGDAVVKFNEYRNLTKQERTDRMMYLYDIASRHKGLVMSTDNQTEYQLGFWTIHGDVGDFDPIQDLWKTEVYELAKWISNRYKNIEHHHTIMTGAGSKSDAIELSIALTPTDGLGISNSDLEQIGAKSYDEVDDILSRYIPFKEYRQKHGEPLHPHDEMAESDCWSQLCARHGEDVVNKVWSRHLASEFKRKKAPIYISRELYE